MKYAAVIRDYHNVIVRVEERPTRERALKAAHFFSERVQGGWWFLAIGEEEVEMYKSLINA